MAQAPTKAEHCPADRKPQPVTLVPWKDSHPAQLGDFFSLSPIRNVQAAPTGRSLYVAKKMPANGSGARPLFRIISSRLQSHSPNSPVDRIASQASSSPGQKLRKP